MTAEQLEQQLAQGALSKDELKRIAGAVKALAGLDLDEIFPVGIVRPDGLRGRARVAPGRIGGLMDDLVAERNAPVRSWRVFPVGIPAPDQFVLEVDIGRPWR